MPSKASNNDNAPDSDDESVGSVSVRISSTTTAGDVASYVSGPKADWKPAILRAPLPRPSLPGLPRRPSVPRPSVHGLPRRRSSPRVTKEGKLGCFGMTAYLLFMGGAGAGIGYFIAVAAGWVNPWTKGAESATQSSAQLAAIPAQMATNETSTPTYMPTLVLTPAPTVAINDVATADPPTGAPTNLPTYLPTFVPTSAEPEIESVKNGPGGALEVTEFVLDETEMSYPAEVAEDEPKRRRLRTGATRRQEHE